MFWAFLRLTSISFGQDRIEELAYVFEELNVFQAFLSLHFKDVTDLIVDVSL